MSFQINPEISKASTLPKEFYLDKKYFNFCIENIFPHSWQMVADKEMLNQSNIYPFILLPNFLDEPLVLINNKNEINCFSNVCTHRAHLVAEKPCNGKKLRCMYHGRTFKMDGNFNSMPGFEEAENFPTENDNLHSIPSLIWANFIFVSLSGEIDITPVINDIEKRIPNYPFKDLVYNENSSKRWEIDTHWALYCENFLEGFHVPFVHKGLTKEIDIEKYETVLLNNAVLQIAKCDKYCDILRSPANTNDRIYGLYYWIFPNIMLNFYSWGLSINIIEPISTTHTRLRFLSYPIKNKIQPSKGAATLSQVETEDQKVVLNVQKGIRSRHYNAGRYSPQYERGVHHFHLLLDSYLS